MHIIYPEPEIDYEPDGPGEAVDNAVARLLGFTPVKLSGSDEYTHWRSTSGRLLQASYPGGAGEFSPSYSFDDIADYIFPRVIELGFRPRIFYRSAPAGDPWSGESNLPAWKVGFASNRTDMDPVYREDPDLCMAACKAFVVLCAELRDRE